MTRNTNIISSSIRTLTTHEAGTLYLSLPQSYSKILNEKAVVAIVANDKMSIILKPASNMEE